MKVGDLVRKHQDVWRAEDCQQFGIVTYVTQKMVYVTFIGEKVWKSAYAEYELEVINDESR
mgnify:CR=1 FL=1|jgi:hypothetical protein|tara:strand:+ start:339 stop:521 length:183 start_codon:yes stop_codon:yes gene_type:complete